MKREAKFGFSPEMTPIRSKRGVKPKTLEFNSAAMEEKTSRDRKANMAECSNCGIKVARYGLFTHEEACKRKSQATSTELKRNDRICKICKADYSKPKSKPKDYLTHIEKCTRLAPFIINQNECKFCSKKIQMRGMLFNHIDKNHAKELAKEAKKGNTEIATESSKDNKKSELACPKCNETFNLNVQLKKHIISCSQGTPKPTSDETSKPCKHCQSPKSILSLRGHELNCGKCVKFVKKSGDSFQCIICAKKFKSRNQSNKRSNFTFWYFKSLPD